MRRIAGHYDVLVTIDQSLPQQQNLHRLSFAVVIMQPRSSQIRDLRALLAELQAALAVAKAGEVLIVPTSKP